MVHVGGVFVVVAAMEEMKVTVQERCRCFHFVKMKEKEDDDVSACNWLNFEWWVMATWQVVIGSDFESGSRCVT